PVAPQERVEPPAPLLEKGEHGEHVGPRLHPVPGIVAPSRMGPATVPLLAPARQRHDIRGPLRPAPRPQRHIERKPHRVKSHLYLLNTVCVIAPPPLRRGGST